MKKYLMLFLVIFLCGFCCACSAVTPGPCTTRSSAAALTKPVVPETETETGTASAEPSSEEGSTVREEESSEMSTEEISGGETMVATGAVNVRDAASVNSNVVGSLDAGEKVKKIGEENGWAQILYDGEIRYVSSSYLEAAGE
ncbi:MAG: SH3 domain-containing protein [Clostridiales bacterium]|nr:SH3 domain-containing protein [Clostridiales bacterium]